MNDKIMLKNQLSIFVFFIAGLVLAIGHFHMAASVDAETADRTAAVTSGSPELSSWKLNQAGATGYNGIIANIQQVRYSNNFVYVNSSSIPTYTIGPWNANPNIPTNQSFLFKIPRFPAPQTGTHTATALGTIAFWTDGVAIFNALDGFSYNNRNIWHQDALVNEGISFDTCNGHPAPMGTYHLHINPKCLYNITPTQHSPIVGYAFDGYPIYGAYAYTNADGTGAIKRMNSSYRLRSITNRTVLPDGTVLQPNQYGPSLATKALGNYVEDYEYVSGFGDLDQYNGRFAVTPEYPNGTYAYYVTIYTDGTSAYPYYIGPSYYGIVTTENITSHSHVTITEPVTTYVPMAASVTVSGRVVTSEGRGVRNAILSIRDSQGVARTAFTTPFGYYQFDNVLTGQSYTVSVAARRFSFAQRIVQVNAALSGIDFLPQ